MLPLLLLRLILPALLVGILIWALIEALQPPAQKIARLLRARKFDEAFQLADRIGSLAIIREFLQGELPLPAPGLRRSLEETFEELAALHGAVSDAGNVYIESDLRRELQEGTDGVMSGFWSITRNLAVVAQQQAGFSEDHPKIRRIAKLLEDLQFAAAASRRTLAELTLGATAEELQETREAFTQLRHHGMALSQREPFSS